MRAASRPSKRSVWRLPRGLKDRSLLFPATRSSSLKTSGERFMRRRLCRMRRVTCSCARRPRSTSGTSTTAALPSCGAAAALSAACSSARSRMPSTQNPQLSNLLLDPFFRKAIKDSQRSWRKVVALAARKGIPVPAFSTALAFYDSLSQRAAPSQPPPGPARLFRRAYLRTPRPASRPVLPHQLDRPRRDYRLGHIHGVGKTPNPLTLPSRRARSRSGT